MKHSCIGDSRRARTSSVTCLLCVLGGLAFGTMACATTAKPKESAVAVRVEMARRMLARGESHAALEMLAEPYKRNRDDPEVLLLRGIALREEGLLAEAKAELARAIEHAPRDPRARGAMGIVLDLQGEHEAARGFHRAAIELEPLNADWHNNLGYALLVADLPGEAIPCFEEALRLSPTSARARNNLGFALARVGRMESAAQQFGRGGNPDEAARNLDLARVLMQESAEVPKTGSGEVE